LRLDDPTELKELMADFRATDGFGVVLDENTQEFNHILGNDRTFSPLRGKTVLGTYKPNDQGKTFIDIGIDKNANYLNIKNLETTRSVLHPYNQQFLDCAIGNGDEIILSVNPNDLITSGIKTSDSTFLTEVEYLKKFGYKVSDMPDSDGLYRMILS
jgi:hypothetical protein